MKLSTQTDISVARLGPAGAIRLLADAGYDCLDWSFFPGYMADSPLFGDDWQQEVNAMKAAAAECGVTFNQAHAPFPSMPDEAVRARIVQSIKVAAALGISGIVVHPIQHVPYLKNRGLLWNINLEYYRSLLPLCEEYGIRVYVENMWQYDSARHCIVDSFCARPEEYCAFLDELNSPWMVACLDIGHCALVGQDPADMIRALGHDRLQALHVHDVNYLADNHTVPFTQSLNWEEICTALGEIDYAGDFTFESDNTLTPLPVELLPAAASYMEKIGRYLISRVEAHRK